jgi:hypothetical protein
MRLEELSHYLLVTRFDKSSEILGELIPFGGIRLGQAGSNEGTLSLQESSGLT